MKPDALRLADAICDYSRRGFESEEAAKKRRMEAYRDAAAELRRLSAVNAELLEALNALLNDVGRANSMLGAVKARAAIAKATGGQA